MAWNYETWVLCHVLDEMEFSLLKHLFHEKKIIYIKSKITFYDIFIRNKIQIFIKIWILLSKKNNEQNNLLKICRHDDLKLPDDLFRCNG